MTFAESIKMKLKDAQKRANQDFKKAYGEEIKAGRLVPVGIVKSYLKERIQFYLKK